MDPSSVSFLFSKLAALPAESIPHLVGQVASPPFRHWQFLIGLFWLAGTLIFSRLYWCPGSEITRHQRRDKILFRNKRGMLIWLLGGVGTSAAVATGLIGGNDLASIQAGEPLATYGAAIASVTALGLYGLVFGFVFPILSHRMHTYSGQANRLVLHVSRFFQLQMVTLLLLFYVLAVHARVVCASKWGGEWLAWAATYNMIDGLGLVLLVCMFAHQSHSFIKRVTQQLTTVELISRVHGLLCKIIKWNTKAGYEPIELPEEEPRYKNQQLALPGYRFENEDQRLYALLVCDLGAVARRAVQEGDTWTTQKAIEALDDLVSYIQVKRENLKVHGDTLTLKRPERRKPPKESELTLPHGYVPQEDLLIEHVVKEIDRIVTVATTSKHKNILLQILRTYQRRVERELDRGYSGHAFDWCFFMFARSRRFFYLQMSYPNPWLARRALDMLLSNSKKVINKWEEVKFEVNEPNQQFYDCCLSSVLSSYRKFISMAIVEGETSVLRVAAGHCCEILDILSTYDDGYQTVNRPIGSVVRMLLSGAMFALERSKGECTEIMLDAIIRALNEDKTIVRRELDEILSEYWPAEGESDTRVKSKSSLEDIVRSQLALKKNPKLDLDKEDLLVNNDSMATCAVAILDLVKAYGKLTGRPVGKALHHSKAVKVVKTLRGESKAQYLAWLKRASRLKAVLVAEAAGGIVRERATTDEVGLAAKSAGAVSLAEHLVAGTTDELDSLVGHVLDVVEARRVRAEAARPKTKEASNTDDSNIPSPPQAGGEGGGSGGEGVDSE